MYVVIVDAIAVLLIIGGIMLVARRPRGPSQAAGSGEGDPRAYVRRIAGTMIAAFGLAIGMMVTLFHLLSQSS